MTSSNLIKVNNNPFVSVIIPTLNRFKSLENCLSNLDQSTYQNYEVVVIDQSSDKKTSDLCAKSKVNYFHQSLANLPLARNNGIKNSYGDILLFLDDDITFSESLIEEHVRAYSKDPKIGIVTGRIKLVPPHYYEEHDFIVRLNNKTAKFEVNFDKNTEEFVDFHSGGNFSISRLALGGNRFDTFYRGNALYEEVDFAIAIKKKKFKILFNPMAEITHLREETGGSRDKDKSSYYIDKFFNTSYFYYKNLKTFSSLTFLITMKNEIEYYTRRDFGHDETSVLKYSLSVFVGFLAGIIRKF